MNQETYEDKRTWYNRHSNSADRFWWQRLRMDGRRKTVACVARRNGRTRPQHDRHSRLLLDVGTGKQRRRIGNDYRKLAEERTEPTGKSGHFHEGRDRTFRR